MHWRYVDGKFYIDDADAEVTEHQKQKMKKSNLVDNNVGWLEQLQLYFQYTYKVVEVEKFQNAKDLETIQLGSTWRKKRAIC